MKYKEILSIGFILIPVVLVSYLNLWMHETSLKYIFTILEFFMIISLYVCLKNVDILKLNISMDILKNLDFIIVFLTFFLCVISFLGIHNFLTFIIAIFITFFGLGFILLRFFNFYPLKSNFEWLVLSFWFSITINCIIYSLNLIFSFSKQASLIAIQYFIFTFIYI